MVLMNISILLFAISLISILKIIHRHEERLDRLTKLLITQNEFNRVINDKIDNVNERLCKKEKK
jgi:hypothetical protein